MVRSSTLGLAVTSRRVDVTARRERQTRRADADHVLVATMDLMHVHFGVYR